MGLTLGSWNLLHHAIRLCPESVSTMLWTYSFKASCQRYNILEMDEEGNTPEQKLSGVGFQFFPVDHYTWG